MVCCAYSYHCSAAEIKSLSSFKRPLFATVMKHPAAKYLSRVLPWCMCEDMDRLFFVALKVLVLIK